MPENLVLGERVAEQVPDDFVVVHAVHALRQPVAGNAQALEIDQPALCVQGHRVDDDAVQIENENTLSQTHRLARKSSLARAAIPQP